MLTTRSKILEPSVESKVRVVVAITTLLKHAPDLGTSQLTKDGMLEMMMGMARSVRLNSFLNICLKKNLSKSSFILWLVRYAKSEKSNV